MQVYVSFLDLILDAHESTSKGSDARTLAGGELMHKEKTVFDQQIMPSLNYNVASVSCIWFVLSRR